MSTLETTETRSDARAILRMEVQHGLNFFVEESEHMFGGERLRRTKYLPEQLINKYLDEALKTATVNRLETGAFFAEIPGFSGVWASNDDLGRCETELRDFCLIG